MGVVLPAKGKKITPFKPLFFSKSWQRPPSFYWEVAYLGARDFLRRLSKVKKISLFSVWETLKPNWLLYEQYYISMPIVSDNSLLRQLARTYPELSVLWEQSPSNAFWLLEEGKEGMHWVSEALARQLGYHPEEFKTLNLQLWDLVHPEDISLSKKRFTENLKTQAPFEHSLRYLHKNGHPVTVHVKGKAVLNPANNTKVFSGIHLSTSGLWVAPDWKHETPLNKFRLFSLFFNNSLYGAFFMMLDSPIWWDDKQDKEALLDQVMEHQRVTEVNHAMLDQHKAQREDFIGCTPLDLFPQDPKSVRALWRQLFDNGRLKLGTNERTVNGKKLFFEVDYLVLYDDSGRITGHFGIQQEVTERVQSQSLLKASREQLLRITQNIPGVVYELRITKAGWVSFDFLSEQWKSLNINLEPKGLFRDASELFSIVLSQDVPEFTRKMQASYRERSLFDHSYRIRDKDGKIRWHRSKSRPEVLPNGDLLYAGLFYDITSERETANTLSRLALVAEKTSDIILTCQPDGKMDWANLALERLLGYTPESMRGFHIFDLASGPDSDQESLELLQACLEQGKTLQTTTILYHVNGKPCWFNVQITPIVQNARHHQSIVVLHPLDELMEKQASLQRLVDLSADQNKRLQNFAYIVSHNIRSHAANISSLVELLETSSSPEDQEQLKAMLKKSSKQLDETIKHLNDVISLNKELNTSRVSVHVTQTIEKALQPMSQIIKNSEAQLQFHIEAKATIYTVPAYFESIVFNLISNALKYNKPGEAPVVDVYWETKADHHLLKVQDRGLGIDLERYGDRLFNMYQTFHRVQDAKGIGLFLTRNQVEAMGGEIGVNSTPNEGATFWVKFPLNPKTEDANIKN